MAIKEPVHPAELYANVFLVNLLASDAATGTARSSEPLPVLAGVEYVPDFARFRNRLKIMAGLDPVMYRTPRTGSFQVSTDRQLNGAWYEYRHTVHLLFTDAATDPSVEIRVELTSREPTIDPALCL
jgi:hypothetical protein